MIKIISKQTNRESRFEIEKISMIFEKYRKVSILLGFELDDLSLKGHCTRLRKCTGRLEMHLTTLFFDQISEKLSFDTGFR